MGTNVGKAIIGTFLILLGIPGVLFALGLLFSPNVQFSSGVPDLSTRIIFSVVAGFIPLIFLVFGLKLLLPIMFGTSGGTKIPSEEVEQPDKEEGWILSKDNTGGFSYIRDETKEEKKKSYGRYGIVITEEDREKLKNVNLLMGGVLMIILKTWTDWFREIREVRKMHLGMSFYAGMMEVSRELKTGEYMTKFMEAMRKREMLEAEWDRSGKKGSNPYSGSSSSHNYP